MVTSRKSIQIGNGEQCPKCGRPMVRWSHPPHWGPKKHQPFYFAYWDRCQKCHHLQHYEAAKVFVNAVPLMENSDEVTRIRAIMEQLGESAGSEVWGKSAPEGRLPHSPNPKPLMPYDADKLPWED